MFIELPKTKKCRESRVIQTHRVFPNDLNSFGALYGGKLMSFIDDTTSIAASRHCRRPTMTASTDKLDFLHPIYENHSVCVEAYVSGTGKKSMEIFTKVLGEDLATGERYLAATCFMTFVIVESEYNFQGVPTVIPETNEEKMIHQGYEKRRELRMKELEHSKDLANHISLTNPWMDEVNIGE
ncbi:MULTISPECIES: acyl-CoA thioesterase [Vagococcus]|uniref:Acyl-CoA hydrolase n=1 Tax=Vagococcus fluvialis bH819 TaxID=1255619 RepID=A0A1X6WLM5_9ENTE|nr:MULTISPECIES: acyl-CoA thioesterase [Vagococcus]SLM85160.1 Acyl-CoA hydrolase [Vagococcus fluvialis bH819]HCM88427.1 acyl-CoA thioesterase [Vagococcus sp.]